MISESRQHGRRLLVALLERTARRGRIPSAPREVTSTMVRFRRSLMLLLVLISGIGIARSQSTDVKDLGIGKLLVSARGLPDPNFVNSVVLLIQHDQQGTLGLMVNRRTRAPISRVLRDLKMGKEGSDPVYLGGPVELDAVFGLTRSRKKLEGATSVVNEVYLLSNKTLLEKTLTASPGPGDFRLYIGYCGWAGGQLENEVMQGGWWIFNADANLVFDPDPPSVWSRLIARAERQIAGTGRVGGFSPEPRGSAATPATLRLQRELP